MQTPKEKKKKKKKKKKKRRKKKKKKKKREIYVDKSPVMEAYFWNTLYSTVTILHTF